MTDTPLAIFWFRRDLRLHDNAGLYHALRSGLPVLPLFIFDRSILNQLHDKKDARVSFIYQRIAILKQQLQSLGSDLVVRYGTPEEVWKELLETYPIRAVYTNRDDEPYALKRDHEVEQFLSQHGATLYAYKDQVIFDRHDVMKDDGTPYTVFTPYAKRWKAKLFNDDLRSYPSDELPEAWYRTDSPEPMPSLDSIGFESTDIPIPDAQVSRGLIKAYHDQRDFPGIQGTSRLGIHFRFGTISVREKVKAARELSETFLNELIWREFYKMILFHFPHIGEGKAFRASYDRILWRNNESEFSRWCDGMTGVPIVDAGMRELNATGWMHNRVRMITASFLTKHLLIDWRWGEAYFASRLLDFDLSANNGGWQWAAGCGTDAAPYFRVFNPWLQAKKFDPDGTYIRKWVPEAGTPNYPGPMVDHDMARKRCLETYKVALRG